MRTKDRTGRWGEETAARFLAAAGLQIVERNWRCEFGELDIVAREQSSVVFCEVKTRRGTGFGDPAEAVTWRKTQRLRRLGRHWLDTHPGTGAIEIRFDVVAVLCPPGGPATVRHVRGAF